VQVVGQHDHDAPGRHTDQEGEVGDVEAPGHVTVHARDAQAEVQLLQVDQEGNPDQAEQQGHPSVVSFSPFDG